MRVKICLYLQSAFWVLYRILNGMFQNSLEFFWIFTTEFCKELKRNLYWCLLKVICFHKTACIFVKYCQCPFKMSLSSQSLREFRLSCLSCHKSCDLSLLGVLVRKKYLIPKVIYQEVLTTVNNIFYMSTFTIKTCDFQPFCFLKKGV